MAALQLVGIEHLFPRSGGKAASRSSRRATCRASLPAFTLIALMPYSGLQAQLAGVQAGARHAAQACRLSPHNRPLYPVQTRSLAACRTFLASAPEVLLAIITQFRIDFEGYGSTFESALCQKAVRRAVRRNGVCGVATPTEEPLAARRALQPLKPPNASHAQSPTGGLVKRRGAIGLLRRRPQYRVQRMAHCCKWRHAVVPNCWRS